MAGHRCPGPITSVSDLLLRRSSPVRRSRPRVLVIGQVGLPVSDHEAPCLLRQSGTQRARCMDQEAGWTALDRLGQDSTVLGRHIARRAAPTAPEAVGRLHPCLRASSPRSFLRQVSDPALVRHTNTVGDSRSSGAAPRGHPLESALVGSRCGKPWWSAFAHVGSHDLLIRSYWHAATHVRRCGFRSLRAKQRL